MTQTKQDLTRINAISQFPVGRIVATPAVMQLFNGQANVLTGLLARHQSGDWGQLSNEDWKANEEAIKHGWRILSVYRIGGVKVWIITEADRSATTILLPEEY